MQTNTQDFARLVECQQLHNTLTTRLKELEVDLDKAAQASAVTSAPAYVCLQEDVSKVESEITQLFNRNPGWRGDQKSVKTPFGAVESRSVTKLKVANPAVTVTLIKARGTSDPDFKAHLFLHIEELPNIEALEGLQDDELAKLGVTRETTEKVTVSPVKANVAKAVKAAKQAVTVVGMILLCVLFTGCERIEYGATLSEPAKVYDTCFVPAGHGMTSGGWSMSYKGKMHYNWPQSIDIPATYAIVFQCQHGKFTIDGDRGEALYKKLSKGDSVIVSYAVKYRVTDGATNAAGLHFIDADKAGTSDVAIENQ
jgi:hypothetical protein